MLRGFFPWCRLILWSQFFSSVCSAPVVLHMGQDPGCRSQQAREHHSHRDGLLLPVGKGREGLVRRLQMWDFRMMAHCIRHCTNLMHFLLFLGSDKCPWGLQEVWVSPAAPSSSSSCWPLSELVPIALSFSVIHWLGNQSDWWLSVSSGTQAWAHSTAESAVPDFQMTLRRDKQPAEVSTIPGTQGQHLPPCAVPFISYSPKRRDGACGAALSPESGRP